MIDSQFFQEKEISIRNITIIAGSRPAGRTVDRLETPRTDHGILFLWEGEAHFSSPRIPDLALHPGELFYIPAGCCYKMQYTAHSTCFVLVNLDMLSADGKAIFLDDHFAILARDDEKHRFFEIMVHFERCATESGPGVSCRKKELAYRLLGAILEANHSEASNQNKASAILPGVLMLQKNYLENIPIVKFSEVCNISLTNFRSQFTKKYGMSPLQYRNHLRIERAITLLQEGSCTVAEAAYAAGFENIGYFCRYYKKITGHTPAETRRHALARKSPADS